MQLFSVRFTTKHCVSKYDAKGKLIGQIETEIEQTLTSLPEATALSYRRFANFRMEPYAIESTGRSGKSTRGAYTPSREERSQKRETTSTKATTSRPARTAVQSAAATGDMSAAINARN